MNKALVVVLSVVMLDAIGIGLIFPILPALLRDVAHTGEIATLLGIMLALYSAMQFLFSPVLGVLSDRYGRRPVLLISLGGAGQPARGDRVGLRREGHAAAQHRSGRRG